jgi:hypothetical protein
MNDSLHGGSQAQYDKKIIDKVKILYGKKPVPPPSNSIKSATPSELISQAAPPPVGCCIIL